MMFRLDNSLGEWMIGALVSIVLLGLWPTVSRAIENTPVVPKAVAARVRQSAARCKAHAVLDACDDAVRWDPSDAKLLVAYGDALALTHHRADALRQYRRAAALAPQMPGVAAKIKSLQSHSTPKRSPAKRATVEAHAIRKMPAPGVSPESAKASGSVNGARTSAAAPVSSAAASAGAAGSATPVPKPAPTYSNDMAETHSH